MRGFMTRSFKYFLLAVAIFTTLSFMWFLKRQHQQTAFIISLPQQSPSYYKTLNNFDEFLSMQGLPLSSKFTDVLSVKVVYDIRSQVLFFLNSKMYNYHFEFCEQVLGFQGGLELFNTHNYSDGPMQYYYLANLNYYKATSCYALEFTGSTTYSAELIKDFYQSVIDHSYLKDSLRILLSTDHLLGLAESNQLNIPLIYPDQIYKGQQTQLLQTGISYGMLRKMDDIENEYRTVNPGDIIIIKGTPLHVPVCAGLITNSFQTPLSHIQVLCHNRNIPAAVDKNIWQKNYLDVYVNKLVKLTVSEDTTMIEAADTTELNEFLAGREQVKTLRLESDLSVTELISGKLFGLNRRNSIGNKAAGLGELQKLSLGGKSLFSVPEGAFAIPFFYYQQHISNPLVQTEIDKLVNNRIYLQSNDSLKKQLKQIREAIKKLKINAVLLSMVEEQIIKNEAGKSYRFRSSGNAEDLDNFSGAGLYSSKTGKLNDTEKPIEDAVKAVWASTWNYEAFVERSFHRIDQRTVMMGVLVHRNFPDELANGVAITKNLYRPSFPGFTVNVQLGEVSVVNAPDSVTCEQFVCLSSRSINPHSNEVSADYLTLSSLSSHKAILNNEQISTLFKALNAVKEYFYWQTSLGNPKPEYEQYALDLEFKFDRNGKLYIKQVRPY